MSRQTSVRAAPKQGDKYKLALVLWNGDVGGAEILYAKLAECMHKLGSDATILFIGSPWPLAERLSRADIPYQSLGFGRGRDVLRHPRRYATEIARAGSDGALLVERGFMATALRIGGYVGPIIAVEHGPLLFEQKDLTRPQRLLRRIGRLSGAWTTNAEVAVSDFMLEQMREHTHARRIIRIYNGIETDVSPPTKAPARNDRDLVVGFAGRLVPGKGTDHLIRALVQVHRQTPVKLLIAGGGPEYARLTSLARSLDIGSQIEFLGVVNDLAAFWEQCDIAAIPSDTFIESFSMVTLEAMASSKPIVATRNGAIPELILDGRTGTLVPPGDVDAFARALVTYAEQPALRYAHGAAARTRARERFLIEDCGRAYLNLFGELAASPRWTLRSNLTKTVS